MPISVPAPRRHRVPVVPLTAGAFAEFGEVVESPLRVQEKAADAGVVDRRYSPTPSSNPSTSLTSHSSTPTRLPPNAVYANQGTAVKILDVSHVADHYAEAPSGQPSMAVMNMFVCSPRALRREGSTTVGLPQTANRIAVGFEDVVGANAGRPGEERERLLFDVEIVERHPFTSQTFIPMGLAAKDPSTCYLVVVAPTLPTGPGGSSGEELQQISSKRPASKFFAKARASLSGAGPVTASTGQRKGPGLPDLQNLRAFLANGRQAVTYGAGTWHAPMVVLGLEKVEFVVVQFANGVALEDCQEVELQTQGLEGEGIAVVLEVGKAGNGRGWEERVRARL